MGAYGLLGEHLGHSFSPQIHALLGDYGYELCEVQPGKLDSFLADTKLDGMNVTIPYKKAVMSHCCALSREAERIGSVNTLLRTENGWYGDNTDYFGFRYMLLSGGVDPKGKKALVFGSGGASLTVCAVLSDLGAVPVVISRSGENNYENLSRHHDAEILVNTTPVGMYPANGAAVCSLEGFASCRLVLDLVYNPARTALLLDAEARGIPAVNGLGMLVAQAHRAAELFTGSSIPPEKIEEIRACVENQTRNIVLVGMPGCGKTHKGRLLARRLGRSFVDSDEFFAARYGCTAAEMILREGEAAFRRAESGVLRELGAKSGLVIATGGGCVTIPENYELLHQNGLIVWLRRPVSELSTKNRPLSKAGELSKLYEKRRESYERFADVCVDSAETVEKGVDAIMEVIK